MTDPVLLAVASAAPDLVIDQSVVWHEFYQQLYPTVPDARRLFVDASQVQRRHFHWDPREAYRDGFPPTGARIDAWEQGALDLGRRTVPAVLAGVDRTRVGTFVMVSTTGYTCPGPETLLAQQLGLRPDVRRLFVGHMGCFAAFVGLRAALDALAARPDELVLLTCTELTSMHVRPDATTEQAVVHGLFGDASATLLLGARLTTAEAVPPVAPDAAATAVGAAAAVGAANVGAANGAAANGGAAAVGARVVATRGEVHPGTAEHMSIQVREDGFRLMLSPAIPSLLATTTPGFVERLLDGTGLGVADVRHWALHPGGPRIVDKVGAALGLSHAQLRPSREVLRDYGNCSSATVLLVLERLLALDRPAPGDYAVMMAFGPGLTTEAALLRF